MNSADFYPVGIVSFAEILFDLIVGVSQVGGEEALVIINPLTLACESRLMPPCTTKQSSLCT